MAYAREAKLFVELAQPDKNGFSRWVNVNEFVGEYEPLSSKNGYPWLRDGSHDGTTKSELSKRYKIERRPPTGKLEAIRLAGHVDKYC